MGENKVLKIHVSAEQINKHAADPHSSLKGALVGKLNAVLLPLSGGLIEDGISAKDMIEAIRSLDLKFLAGVLEQANS